MQATVEVKPGSDTLFALTAMGQYWAIPPEQARQLSKGQNILIKITDQADQFCKVLSSNLSEIFLAIDTYKLQIRCYTGNQTVEALGDYSTHLLKEATQLAQALALPPPREPYITSTFMGVTVICEIPYVGGLLTNAVYDQVVTYQKHRKWKLSRK